MREKVDEQIRTLIENGVKARHNLVTIRPTSKSVVKSRPNVLWCYTDKLELSSYTKKRMQRGLLDPEEADPFSLFVETAGITYCLYRDSDGILGNTFSMCILQDFDALTPNLLARTIENVEGGGLIVLLLRSLSSLTSLCTMVMDAHERYCKESHSQAAARFNERFLLSLASCKSCIVMDDELNILPISSQMKSISSFPVREDSERLSEAERELKNLKEQLNDDFPVGPLIRKCCTVDQGKAVVTFLDAILDKSLRSTVALFAARCRGKSAALGLAVAGAVAAGYSNIFVTAPSPENLKTLFEFICKGFDLLDYKEHIDYEVVKSSNPHFKKATVRIDINKHHRQTIRQLEEQHQISSRCTEAAVSGRVFKKIELSESIRYASGDPMESWLNALLCLDVTNTVPSIRGLTPPSECGLYYVNLDTLFSCYRDSELFLQWIMALFVASDYKYSPNDLQLMADAPAHHLFVLLGPVDESSNHLPDIFCVLQICFEGQISRTSAIKSLVEGGRIVRIATHPSAMRLGYGSAAVELLSRYFEGRLTPISELDVEEQPEDSQARITEAAEEASLLQENIKPRTNLLPLLVPLSKRRPEKLRYLGMSFGLTLDLFRFWRKHNFVPFFICPVANNVTGEHTCMVLRRLNNDDIETSGSNQLGYLNHFYQVFREKFTGQLLGAFREMEYKLAMSILGPKINFSDGDPTSSSSTEPLNSISEALPSYAMMYLEVYANNHLDHGQTDDFNTNEVARSYFWEKIPVTLSYAQASILLCLALQKKKLERIEEEMKLERPQILSLYLMVMKKFYNYLSDFETEETHSTASHLIDIAMEPHPIPLDKELNNAA